MLLQQHAVERIQVPESIVIAIVSIAIVIVKNVIVLVRIVIALSLLLSLSLHCLCQHCHCQHCHCQHCHGQHYHCQHCHCQHCHCQHCHCHGHLEELVTCDVTHQLIQLWPWNQARSILIKFSQFTIYNFKLIDQLWYYKQFEDQGRLTFLGVGFNLCSPLCTKK